MASVYGVPDNLLAEIYIKIGKKVPLGLRFCSITNLLEVLPFQSFQDIGKLSKFASDTKDLRLLSTAQM